MKLLLVFLVAGPLTLATVTYAQTLESTVSQIPATLEALSIKGSKTITFSQRTLEGTKEGFAPGSTREESLKVNISGPITEDTTLNANLFSTYTASDSEDKLSISIKKGPHELYFGDFLADLNETEFTGLNRNLSGMRFTSSLKLGKFLFLWSNPKGNLKKVKLYGNRTQGPYNLGATNKVVVDSEAVLLDGRKQKKGDDYDIDYNAGTVTFRKKIILDTEVLEINFEDRSSAYQRALYGYRAFVEPSERWSLGLTYLKEADDLSNAQAIQAATGINPTGQDVFGVDGSLSLGPLLAIEGEGALSKKDNNLLDKINPEQGKAAKVKATSQAGPFTLSADLKRIENTFESLSEASAKKDLWEGGGALSFVPSPNLFTQIDYNQQEFRQNDVPYAFRTKRGKLDLAPEILPSLNYQYWQEASTTDYVTALTVDRTKTRHALKLGQRLGFLNLSLQGAQEIWEDRIPSLEATVYKTAQLGIATIGLKNITGTLNYELKQTTYPAGNQPLTNTYDLNLEAKPHESLNLNAQLKWVDDTEQGFSSATDLAFKLRPINAVQADGKYNIQSLEESFSGTDEAVNRHTASLQLALSPSQLVRLRYYYKPTFTELRANRQHTYENMVNQYELQLAPIQTASSGLIFKTTDQFTVDKTDPLYLRKQNFCYATSLLASLKLAPLQFLSTELTYSEDKGQSNTLASAEALTYDTTDTTAQKIEIAVKTSITERFSTDTKYTYARNLQVGNGVTHEADSETQTAMTKWYWNVNPALLLYISGALSRTLDFLPTTTFPETYAISPGCGFTFKGDILRIDYDYLTQRSYYGSPSEVTTSSLQTKLQPNTYLALTLKWNQEISGGTNNYKATELVGNVEINL